MTDDKKEYLKKWREANKERVKATSKAYLEKHKERFRESRLHAVQRYQSKNPERVRTQSRGMIFSEGQTIEGMRIAQEGKCAISGVPFGEGNAMHVDHCHETGYVRALFVQRINMALGGFRDDPELLRKAADYIEFHRKLIAEKQKNDNTKK